MTDAAVENAAAIRDDMAAKIAAAEVQIKEWRAKKDRAERFIADWEEFSGRQAPAPIADTPSEPAPRSVSGPKPKNPKKEEVAAIAREILMENGEPMSRDELHAALIARGVVIHGGNPAVVLQTMLWRMQSVIVHLKGFGYWPTDQAYMAADYVSNAKPDETEDPDDLDDDAKSLI